MSQYRNGYFTSTGAAVTLMLGFVPDHINVYNYTAWTAASGVNYSTWLKNVTPVGYAMIETVGIPSTITSNGFTPVILGGDWQNTNYTITAITNANPGVVTLSSISPTNSLTLVNGMTVTISGVVGVTGLNTNRFIVTGISGNTFKLYDTFGNPVDTTALGTYVSGGIVNQISYPPTAPILNATNGQVITPGQPAGNQYDIGYEGIILGTGVVGSSTNVIWWEAFDSTPTGW